MKKTESNKEDPSINNHSIKISNSANQAKNTEEGIVKTKLLILTQKTKKL